MFFFCFFTQIVFKHLITKKQISSLLRIFTEDFFEIPMKEVNLKSGLSLIYLFIYFLQSHLIAFLSRT